MSRKTFRTVFNKSALFWRFGLFHPYSLGKICKLNCIIHQLRALLSASVSTNCFGRKTNAPAQHLCVLKPWTCRFFSNLIWDSGMENCPVFLGSLVLMLSERWMGKVLGLHPVIEHAVQYSYCEEFTNRVQSWLAWSHLQTFINTRHMITDFWWGHLVMLLFRLVSQRTRRTSQDGNK